MLDGARGVNQPQAIDSGPRTRPIGGHGRENRHLTTSHPDKLLARRLARGDARAFDRFFDEHFPRLYRFTAARIGHDDAAVKDVVQRTLCRGIEKLGSYRGEAALYTWLCTICRREISDHLRRRSRIEAREVPFDDSGIRAVLEALETGPASDPVRGAERAQLSALIAAILDHLPARQGNALEWKYVEGLSVREIAARLRVTETAAQSLLARARRAFRDGFDELVQSGLDGYLR